MYHRTPKAYKAQKNY